MGDEGFKLDRILNYRREVEKVCSIDLAAATTEFEGAIMQLNLEEKSMQLITTELARRQEEGIYAGELQLYSNCRLKKNGEIRKHRQNVACLGEFMEVKRESLLDAAKDKKTMEIYKERKNRSLQKKITEREQTFLNEIAIRKRCGG